MPLFQPSSQCLEILKKHSLSCFISYVKLFLYYDGITTSFFIDNFFLFCKPDFLKKPSASEQYQPYFPHGTTGEGSDEHCTTSSMKRYSMELFPWLGHQLTVRGVT